MTPSATRALATLSAVEGPSVPAIAPGRISPDDWYGQLGLSHRRRDEAASDRVRALQAREREHEATLRRRWPGIVAELRDLVRRYNDGAGLEALTVADDPGGEGREPTVTIAARAGQALTVTLSGVELCVQSSRDTAGAPSDGRRWIALGAATDGATAAYALQDWLTHL